MLAGRYSDRLFEPVQIVGGPGTRAIIQRPVESGQPTREMAETRTFARTLANTLIRVGDVLRVGDQHYLAADHPSTGRDKVFRLFPADRLVSWERTGTIVDPLTQRPKGTGPVDMGDIWVVWDMITREPFDLNIRIGDQKHLVITGADVHDGDLLDGETVKRVNTALGLRVLEVQ
jgi:hypothetical protein